jgi:Holliday junction resolvasome RuvABC DNA-binding subunit
MLNSTGGGSAPMGSAQADALAGLMGLGYSQAEAQKAIAKVAQTAPGASSAELIKLSLKVKG